VLDELYPPITTITSGGPCGVLHHLLTASCRSCVAEQMVSKERKCEARSNPSARAVAPLQRRGRPPRRSRATRPASIVVWLAHADPLQVQVRIEAGRGLVAKCSRNSSRESAPGAARCSPSPAAPRPCRDDDVGAARVLEDLARRRLGLLVVVLAVDQRGEPVARVLVDRFQTLSTLPQVVSTRTQPICCRRGNPRASRRRPAGSPRPRADAREIEPPAPSPVLRAGRGR
jgi:hypothetical protein